MPVRSSIEGGRKGSSWWRLTWSPPFTEEEWRRFHSVHPGRRPHHEIQMLAGGNVCGTKEENILILRFVRPDIEMEEI